MQSAPTDEFGCGRNGKEGTCETPRSHVLSLVCQARLATVGCNSTIAFVRHDSQIRGVHAHATD